MYVDRLYKAPKRIETAAARTNGASERRDNGNLCSEERAGERRQSRRREAERKGEQAERGTELGQKPEKALRDAGHQHKATALQCITDNGIVDNNLWYWPCLGLRTSYCCGYFYVHQCAVEVGGWN